MPGPALTESQVARLASEGYLLLRGAVPADLLDQARAAFEAGYVASDKWPTPREAEWRHAMVDLDPAVQAICRLPSLLEGAGLIVGEAFFLMQVEGRDPLPGNAAQCLHRDAEGSQTRYAVALVFLDDFGPDNGATALVPGSHLSAVPELSAVLVTSGQAGDVLLLDANLFHGATSNTSEAPRRSFLASYAGAGLRQSLCESEALRGVRMDTSEVFAARA